MEEYEEGMEEEEQEEDIREEEHLMDRFMVMSSQRGHNTSSSTRGQMSSSNLLGAEQDRNQQLVGAGITSDKSVKLKEELRPPKGRSYPSGDRKVSVPELRHQTPLYSQDQRGSVENTFRNRYNPKNRPDFSGNGDIYIEGSPEGADGDDQGEELPNTESEEEKLMSRPQTRKVPDFGQGDIRHHKNPNPRSEYDAEVEQQQEGSGEEEQEDSVAQQGISLHKLKKVIVDLQQELRKKDKENRDLEAANDELMRELKQISEDFIGEREQNQNQLNRFQYLEAEFKRIEKESSDKVAINSEFKQKHIELQQKYKEAAEALEDSSRINTELKTMVEEKDGVIEQMEVQMKKFLELKDQFIPIFTANEQIASKYRSLEKEFVKKEELLQNKDVQIKALEQNLKEASEIIAKIPKMKEYIEEFKLESEASKAELEVFRKKAASFVSKEDYDKVREELEITKQEAELSKKSDQDLNKINKMLEQIVAGLTEETQLLKGQLETLEGEKQELIEVLNSREQEKSQLEQQLKSKDREMKDLTTLFAAGRKSLPQNTPARQAQAASTKVNELSSIVEATIPIAQAKQKGQNLPQNHKVTINPKNKIKPSLSPSKNAEDSESSEEQFIRNRPGSRGEKRQEIDEKIDGQNESPSQSEDGNEEYEEPVVREKRGSIERDNLSNIVSPSQTYGIRHDQNSPKSIFGSSSIFNSVDPRLVEEFERLKVTNEALAKQNSELYSQTLQQEVIIPRKSNLKPTQTEFSKVA